MKVSPFDEEAGVPAGDERRPQADAQRPAAVAASPPHDEDGPGDEDTVDEPGYGHGV